MIPKKIHYCWFGENSLPEKAQKCIASWKKYCPDYEIIEWNENNYDINCCDYVKEAYQAKKWAFVSDYARFDILYKYGGLYFDTDVELIRSIDDIVAKGAFMGVENNVSKMVAPGLGLAVNPGDGLYKEILEFYNNNNFLNKDGSFNQTTVVSYTTNILKQHGLIEKSEIQCIKDIYIYPYDYFCPMSYETGELSITENTRSIHHFSGSWHTPEELKFHRFEQKVRKIYGRKIAHVMGKIYSFPYRVQKKLNLMV